MTIAEELRAEGEARGEVRGKATSLFLVLEARGFHLDESLRTRVMACSDAEVLDQWVRRAVTVERPEDLFEV